MFWAGWIKHLEASGWQYGEDLSVLGYDWRKGPDAWAVPRVGAFEVAVAI